MLLYANLVYANHTYFVYAKFGTPMQAHLTHSTPPRLSLSLFRTALPSQQPPAGDILVEWVLPYRLPTIVQQPSTTIFVIIYRERDSRD